MSELLGILLLFLIIYFARVSKEYNNPFRLITIIGKKGSGKSTTINALNDYYRSEGWTTYSTEDTPGSYKVEPGEIGYYEMDPYSVLFIDEIGLIWHARDFKNFAKEVREWFKLQRHRKLIVYCFSQSFDIDKGLRDLCDEIWIIKSYFNIFSVRKKIRKNIDVARKTDDQESGFVDELQTVPWFIPGSRKFVYIPKYSGYFDSYAARKLKDKVYPYTKLKAVQTHKHFRVQLHLAWLEMRWIQKRIGVKLLTYRYKKGWIKWL